MASITFNGNTVQNPIASRDAKNTNHIYIQSQGTLDHEQKQALAGLQVKIHEYLGNDVYLCHYEPADLSPIRSLAFINLANVYHKAFKTASSLATVIDHDNDHSKAYTVDILLHKDAADIAQVTSDIATRTGVDLRELSTAHRKIRAHLTANTIKEIENIDSIKMIEHVKQNSLCNNVARVDLVAEAPALNGMTLQGNNQVIAIADSGFDLGSTNDVHPAFKDRVLALIPMTSRSSSSDPIGHGTHVAGSILGDGIAAHMGGKIQGTAPQASLVVQSLLSDDGSLETPQNLWDLFIGPYNDHSARVHSNSWTSNWHETPFQTPYDTKAGALDRFIWHNQDCVICFAAGNNAEGESAGVSQITSSSAAKNCITVGACESSRPSIHYVYSTEKASPNDPAHIAGFSSRGPTSEGRQKPDLVAPGTAILSAASRNPDFSNEERRRFGLSSDPLWTFNSGTSMATPLVSGCAAVLRQGLLAAGHPQPSAALIKALLINGATILQEPSGPDGSEQIVSPYSQGFGRVDLDNSLLDAGKFPNEGFEDSTAALSQGQKWQTELTIPNVSNKGAKPALKVTLAYSDREGAAIQNNLNLTITAADGTQKRGDEGYIAENNVEQVNWYSPPGGLTKITVYADRITRLDDTQPFAIVWRVS